MIRECKVLLSGKIQEIHKLLQIAVGLGPLWWVLGLGIRVQGLGFREKCAPLWPQML